MKNDEKFPIMDLLQIQSSLEHDIETGNLIVLIRTRSEKVVPIKTLKADSEADASIIITTDI